MQALILAAVLGVLPPPPTGPALAAAEADVQEVFGDQLRAARKPADKAALAGKLIETADGSRPAGKYALLEQARELAIAAGDSTVGIRAVEDLVAGFSATTPQDAAQWAAEGHRVWNAAGDKRPADRLRGRLEAAACYLRALPDLAGFQRAAVESRLRELGWGEPNEAAALTVKLLAQHWCLFWGSERNTDLTFRFQPDGTVTHENVAKTRDWKKKWAVERRWVVVTDGNLMVLMPNGELRGIFLGNGQPVGAFPMDRNDTDR